MNALRQRLERLTTSRRSRVREPMNDTIFAARLTAILEAHRRGDPSIPAGTERAVAIVKALRLREIEELL